MIVRPLTAILLALGVALALPLAVDSFLRGGHVTPEQGLRHLLAVAAEGEHAHTADEPGGHLSYQPSAPAVRPAANPVVDGGPTVTRNPPPALFVGDWLGLAALLALVWALPARRCGWRGGLALPPGHVSGVLLPPPRLPVMAPHVT